MRYRDWHNHTHWSDGENTIEELVRRAQKYSIEELGISDHYEMIEDRATYLIHIKAFSNGSQGVSVLAGIEIKIDTLLKLQLDEVLQFNQYDYILIENLEHQGSINKSLEELQKRLEVIQCKIGWAHLDLERLGIYRNDVISFTMKNRMFIDFNYEAPFYANLLQGYEKIDDVLTSGVEVIVGSDTHSIEQDWWRGIVACHNYLKDRRERIIDTLLKQQSRLEEEFERGTVREENVEWVVLNLAALNHTLDLLIQHLPVSIRYCKVDSIRSDTDKSRKNYYYGSLGGGLRASDKVSSVRELKYTPLYSEWVDA